VVADDVLGVVAGTVEEPVPLKPVPLKPVPLTPVPLKPVGVVPVGSPAPVGDGLPVARVVPLGVVVPPAPDAPVLVELPDAGIVMPFTMRGAAVLDGIVLGEPAPPTFDPPVVVVLPLFTKVDPFAVVPLGTSPLPVPAFVAAPGTNGGCERAPALAMVPVGVGDVPAPAAFVAVPEVLAVPGTVGVSVSVGGTLVWLFEATAPVVDGAPLSFAVVDDLLLEADGVEAM
jgi:hypothetical protein